MKYRILCDTNIFIRLSRSDDPNHLSTKAAVKSLIHDRFELIVVPQCFHEFYVVATRPTAAGGLGLSPAQAADDLSYYQKNDHHA